MGGVVMFGKFMEALEKLLLALALYLGLTDSVLSI